MEALPTVHVHAVTENREVPVQPLGRVCGGCLVGFWVFFAKNILNMQRFLVYLNFIFEISHNILRKISIFQWKLRWKYSWLERVTAQRRISKRLTVRGGLVLVYLPPELVMSAQCPVKHGSIPPRTNAFRPSNSQFPNFVNGRFHASQGLLAPFSVFCCRAQL